jgi:glutamate-1-semialdehyde 2,1-aminomutase
MASAAETWEQHKRVIPGGVVSLNRIIDPMRVFVRAQGAYMWDSEDRRYIDYHAAFSPYLLGHADPDVDGAVIEALRNGVSLFGAGTTYWEGELAELIVECVPSLEQVQITNTGSEATFHAIRLSRAYTDRDDVIIMQGGYNGWHNDVAYNVMDSARKATPSEPGGEIPLSPLSAGIPESAGRNVHVVQYNDLKAVERLMKRETIACIILEPILQNVGIIKPLSGYLRGLRKLCDQYGSVLIFDEVKTGFRHALGGYQSVRGVTPDLSTFGKAIANGYPLGAIGGRRKLMEHFCHADASRKVMIAGTYNAHPVPAAAAIATLKKLRDREQEIYGHLETLGAQMEAGLTACVPAGVAAFVARQGSAFVLYFMDHEPRDWLDVATHHDMDRDTCYRKHLIERGIFHFPMPTKQGSISFAHTSEDIEQTLEITRDVLPAVCA